VPIAPGGVAVLLYPHGHGPLLRRASQCRLLRDTGVNGVYVFSEDGQVRQYYRDQTPDLRGYLHARLMWDPEFDVAKGIPEFCEAYYGAAAPELIRYIREINDEKSYVRTSTFSPASTQRHPGFHSVGDLDAIKTDKLRAFDRLFDVAERKVADDDKALRHVKTDRLALQYCILMMLPKQAPIFQKNARRFLAMAKKLQVKRVSNMTAKPDPNWQDLAIFRQAILAE